MKGKEDTIRWLEENLDKSWGSPVPMFGMKKTSTKFVRSIQNAIDAQAALTRRIKSISSSSTTEGSHAGKRAFDRGEADHLMGSKTSSISSWDGGAWISPQGEWLDLPNYQEHYKFVLANPDLFGLSKVDMQTLIDGSASADVLREIRDMIETQPLKKGWLRVRSDQQDKIFYALAGDSPQLVKRLSKMADLFLDKGVDPTAKVNVLIADSNNNLTSDNYSVKDLRSEDSGIMSSADVRRVRILISRNSSQLQGLLPEQIITWLFVNHGVSITSEQYRRIKEI